MGEGEGGKEGAVPDDLEATMVSSGPARSLKPMALSGSLSSCGGRSSGKSVWRETAGWLVSRVTWEGWRSEDVRGGGVRM